MTNIPFPAPPADSAEVLALRSEFRAFLDRLLGHRSPRQRSQACSNCSFIVWPASPGM